MDSFAYAARLKNRSHRTPRGQRQSCFRRANPIYQNDEATVV